MTPQTVAVTGASGFVGRAVCGALDAAGHRVIALARRPSAGGEDRAFDLRQPLRDDTLRGVDAVVHCAYDLSLTDSVAVADVNVRGSERLARAAERCGVRGVLISSMSAYPGTQQIYGQAKLSAETAFLSAGGDAVRLGLVWGGSEGGMIGTLRRLSRLPIVPRLGARTHQFTVHIDDMASAVTRLLERPPVGAALGLAHPAPVPFEEIIRFLRGGRRPVFVPVPWRPVYAVMQGVESAGGNLPVRADSLLGLVRPASRVENAEIWDRIGVTLRPFPRSTRPVSVTPSALGDRRTPRSGDHRDDE